MSFTKWLVSPWDIIRSVEYSKETEHYYMHARGRGRDAKDSTYYRYFDSEQAAKDFVAERNAKKDEQKRLDQIRSVAPELLEALEGMMKCFEDGVGEDWNSKELDAARAVIAKARGEGV